MIDYATYHKIKYLYEEEKLKPIQIARALGLNRRTVCRWLDELNFTPRATVPRSSKLDPYKDSIKRLLERHEYSSVQLFKRIKAEGYTGGITIMRDYIKQLRPRRPPAFLTLTFSPGECAQVDWGEYGTVSVGSTRRKLSFFLMVLCHSRMLYLEFTVLQTMEHFLSCHQNAFHFFGGVPRRVMVDNLKSAVLKRLVGTAPIYNARYLEFARHYGFEIRACTPRKPNEKGRVECGVAFVKKNLLGGLEPHSFEQLGPLAATWRDETANVRLHGETKRRPVDMFNEEREALLPVSTAPYDCGVVRHVRATTRFRVTVDTNRYSVPSSNGGTEAHGSYVYR